MCKIQQWTLKSSVQIIKVFYKRPINKYDITENYV